MAVQVEQLITKHLDLWTQAQTAKSTSGRGSNNKIELTGIKKLRELILELAVRGKLVPQDPNDEPASELLKRIAAEKEALVKAGKLKKQKPLPPITDDEKPFELPQGWEFERLGYLTTLITDGTHHTPNYLESGIPFISVKDIDGKTISFSNCRYISSEQHEEINKRCNPELGDLLICRIGTLGRVTIVDTDRPFSLFVSVGLLKIFKEHILPQFAHMVLSSPFLLQQFEKIKAGGSHTSKLNLVDIPKLVLCLPPLREQPRIVAKVEELMAFCDQLEQQSYQQLDAHNQLVDALLTTLTQSQNADELASNWQRLAAHFDTLFTTEYSIDALKQTILQLAVMGKLVKQDPNDEPASELLKRIAAEKDALVKAGKIKKQKPLPPISDDEKPFELPEGWEWAYLQEITHLITDGKHGDCNNLENSGFYFLSAKDIQNGKLNYDFARQIEPKEFAEVHQRTNLECGDICMVNTGATVGKMALVEDNENTKKTTFQKSVAVIKVANKSVYNKYIAMFLQSETKNFLRKSGGSAINNLLLSDLKRKITPLPPILEQKHIVKKVDELMVLCNNLKNSLQSKQIRQLALATALVEQVVA
ncbi:MAG: restriction endonuclease subunit S [Gammaproteobacteria bacterium]|nr:restriction endonuclease subunit S [Gammaproteobacteria bacterium]